MSTDDSILLQRWVSERDADAFVQVAMRHARMVYNVALRILGNQQDAEEVAQDCFVALASTTKPPKANLSGWLYSVAANQAKTRVRSEHRRQEREERYWATVSAALPSIPDVSWDDVFLYVDEALLTLPENYRETIIAHFFEQETHEAIAQRLGIPRRTVSYHIQQGIELVRQRLKKRGIPITVAAVGTWFDVQATALSAQPVDLAAKIARIGLAGVGSGTPIVCGSVSLLGKMGALMSAKWIGVGIMAAGLVGAALFWTAKLQQVPELSPAPSNQVFSSTIPPVVESSKTTEAMAVPAATSTVEDPLASLWGMWSVEIKGKDSPKTENDEIEIRKEGNNIVFVSNNITGKMTGPIHGLQLQIEGRAEDGPNRITLSGVYTPKADSFEMNGTIVENGKTFSALFIFTRSKKANADQLASLWGPWLLEMKSPENPKNTEFYRTRYDEVVISREGNNIVIAPDHWLTKFSGSIQGLQIEVGTGSLSSTNGITLSGTYTPDANSFQLNGRWKDDYNSFSLVFTFTRLKTKTEVPEASSHLTDDLRCQAEDAFTAQHDNWLSIRRISAKYRWSMKWMENGEWVLRPGDEKLRTGTMAYEMLPITPEEAKILGHPLQLQFRWHVYDNELQWHAAANDIVSGSRKIVYWQEGYDSEKLATPPSQRMLPYNLFNEIYGVMAMSFHNDKWAGSHIPQKDYFKDVAPAVRLSTDEETEKSLGGEKSFIFLPFRWMPRVWISANTGNLHQRDMWEPGQSVLETCRYEDYREEPSSKLSFPSRVVYTFMEGEGSKKRGCEYTIEFSDVRINPDLPPETFPAE